MKVKQSDKIEKNQDYGDKKYEKNYKSTKSTKRKHHKDKNCKFP